MVGGFLDTRHYSEDLAMQLLCEYSEYNLFLKINLFPNVCKLLLLLFFMNRCISQATFKYPLSDCLYMW